MDSPSRKLITTTFIDRLSRLDLDEDILIAVSGILGHDDLYEGIPGANSSMYSIDCGSSRDRITGGPIKVRTVVCRADETWIFCYVAQEDLAHSWAKRHSVRLVDNSDLVEVSELTDQGHEAQAYQEKFIELSEGDFHPSPIADRIRACIATFKMVDWQ